MRLRLPDRGCDVAIAGGGIVKIVDGYELAIGALNGAWVADIATATVIAKMDLFLPTLATIG